ncbi:MAG TPA: hypothetical protein VIJ15_11660 [Dermatophilaceae bacterium]
MHIVTLTNVAGLAEIDAALSDHVVWLDENRPGLDADWGHDLSLNATEGCDWSDVEYEDWLAALLHEQSQSR